MIVAGGRDKKQDGGSVDAVSIQKLISSVANDNVPGGRVSAAYWRVRAFVGRGDWSGAWWAWVRFAAMSHAPADVLSDMAACCLYGGGRWDATRQVVSNLCDNAALPDSVLSLNGHTVKVYNRDGVPLSTVIDGRGVFLVNERTGESVRVPTRASHVFFVGGDVWFHYPNWGEPDLVFDDGWVERNIFPKCRCCGVPVDIDGEACDACEDECLDW